MCTYRCYLLDRADGILSTADIECAGDEEAQQAARRMLRDRSPYDYAIEVWDGARQIFIRSAIQARKRQHDRMVARTGARTATTSRAPPRNEGQAFVPLMRDSVRRCGK